MQNSLDVDAGCASEAQKCFAPNLAKVSVSLPLVRRFPAQVPRYSFKQKDEQPAVRAAGTVYDFMTVRRQTADEAVPQGRRTRYEFSGKRSCWRGEGFVSSVGVLLGLLFSLGCLL